jgi:alpha-amylase
MLNRRRFSAILCILLLIAAGCTPREATPTDEPAPVEAATPESPVAATESPAPVPEPTPPEAPETEGTTGPESAPISLPPSGSEGFPWWNDTVWYEIFVRSFYDSDGDGIGDLQGLIQKLDYLNDGDPATTDDLGITGIWLMPIMQSPSYHGYDVVDYYQVNEEYGTNEDFQQLMEEAHARGIRVIIDMVLNHTSSQHPWFEAALEGDPATEEWYIFHEGERPAQFAPWAGGGNVWHPAGEDRYYYGVFWSEMPDLNFRNPEVTAEAQEISRFWLEEMGADGFRLDGIRLLIEDGRQTEHTEATFEWLEAYQAFLSEVKPEAVTVGEVWSPTNEVGPYVERGALDLAFEFNTATAILAAARTEARGPLQLAQRINARFYPPHQYAPFITNHDQDRAFSQLGNNMERMRMAASLLLTGPGVPFLYYGEEVAMTGRKPDEDIRLPLPWSGEADAGFTEGQPWRDFSNGYEEHNVEAMNEEQDSLLNHYRRLIHLRNNQAALRVGDYTVVNPTTNALHTFLRQSEHESLLVVLNLSGDPVDDYSLSLEAGLRVGEGTPLDLLSEREAAAPELNEQGGFANYRPIETLEPYSTHVIRLRP